MPIVYNGTNVTKIIYNGTNVTKVFYNGNLVFDSYAIIYNQGQTNVSNFDKGTYQNTGNVVFGSDFILLSGRSIVMFGPLNLSEYSSISFSLGSTTKASNTTRVGIVNPSYAPPNLTDWRYINDYDSNWLALTKISNSDFGDGTIKTYTCNISNATKSNVCIMVSVDIGMDITLNNVTLY